MLDALFENFLDKPAVMTSLFFSLTSFILFVFVAIKQYNLKKDGIKQAEYKSKQEIVLNVIDLITKGHKGEFEEDAIKIFWKKTAVGRHLFGKELADFIEECGSRYKMYKEKLDSMDDGIKKEVILDDAAHWFWHQRQVAYEKFDKYFSIKSL